MLCSRTVDKGSKMLIRFKFVLHFTCMLILLSNTYPFKVNCSKNISNDITIQGDLTNQNFQSVGPTVKYRYSTPIFPLQNCTYRVVQNGMYKTSIPLILYT